MCLNFLVSKRWWVSRIQMQGLKMSEKAYERGAFIPSLAPRGEIQNLRRPILPIEFLLYGPPYGPLWIKDHLVKRG